MRFGLLLLTMFTLHVGLSAIPAAESAEPQSLEQVFAEGVLDLEPAPAPPIVETTVAPTLPAAVPSTDLAPPAESLDQLISAPAAAPVVCPSGS
ncbi:MAG TPA: hypothetical protein DDZ90_20260, partial [Planctomycetaceae bacterium]|nr:hypothetical protein [Planctomycetaceae bacterium]